MRLVAPVLLLLAGACGRESPDLAPARAAAKARAEATAAAAKERCRARGETVYEFGALEWVCGEAQKAARDEAETAWRERCEARGTQVYRGGVDGWFCANPTADAGKACTRASDCESRCLLPDESARSGQCAATTVVPGCTVQIGTDGRRGTVCAN